MRLFLTKNKANGWWLMVRNPMVGVRANPGPLAQMSEHIDFEFYGLNQIISEINHGWSILTSKNHSKCKRVCWSRQFRNPSLHIHPLKNYHETPQKLVVCVDVSPFPRSIFRFQPLFCGVSLSRAWPQGAQIAVVSMGFLAGRHLGWFQQVVHGVQGNPMKPLYKAKWEDYTMSIPSSVFVLSIQVRTSHTQYMQV